MLLLKEREKKKKAYDAPVGINFTQVQDTVGTQLSSEGNIQIQKRKKSYSQYFVTVQDVAQSNASDFPNSAGRPCPGASYTTHPQPHLPFSFLFKNKAAPQGRQSRPRSYTARSAPIPVLLNGRQQLHPSK